MTYKEVIEAKIAIASKGGFEVDRDDINQLLFDHQKDIVQWAIRGGKRAIFASFGLGKTFMQLEILRLILRREGGKALVVCPLGVKHEFRLDAEKLGITTEYIRNDTEANSSKADILITNYERVRDGKLDVRDYTAVSLDEASILRGYGTKTYQEFLTLFPSVKYKFVCTATPSPNRYKELIHYAGWLGIMDTGQALTRFFQRDSTKANNLTLYPNMEKEFWLWMASWAVFITKPSDLGYSDERYVMPDMHIHWHEIPVDHSTAGTDKYGQSYLFRDSALSLKDTSREKRETLDDRVAKAVEIVRDNPEKHYLLWHDLEDERRAIIKAIPEAMDVFGTQDLETREERVIGFAEGRIKHLATKPEISGSGCNFQRHCADAIFIGITYKFNDIIQAVHRIYRFLQDREVNVHFIYAESEREVRKVIEEKWQRHKEMVKNMTDIIKEHGLSREAMSNQLKRTIGVKRRETKSELYTAVNNDCVIETSSMPDNSVDLICTSIPFGNHYEYSACYEDFGHNTGNDDFFKQMDHLTPNLLRILRPGRVYACHVKDRIMFGNVTGYGMPSVDPFHALTIAHCLKHGFVLMGMITIETDVVRENNQTYRLGWTEQCKDGTKMGVGCPEYLLLFRKLPSSQERAYADIPVRKSKEDYTRGQWQIDARAKWNSSGNRLLKPDELKQYDIETVNNIYKENKNSSVYDYSEHVALANAMDSIGSLPATFETLRVDARNDDVVWSDINRMRTLNGDQARRNLQMHVCPLQFDIVDRVINRYSNKGETVFDPFGGIMTVPYRAILMGRIGHGVELNGQYYDDGLRYLEMAEREKSAPTLFDMLDKGAA